jgi:uncharacterized cupredoxin-like copper-binding protein
MRPSSQGSRLAALVLVVVAVAGVKALRAHAGSSSHGPVVRISERDFRIKAPKTIRAGVVRLRVHNIGPDTHELLLVRLRGGKLPLRRDGLTVDEEALEPLHLVTIEGMERGKGDEVQVHLVPGRYVLFCNMAGHYLSGMHARVVVR